MANIKAIAGYTFESSKTYDHNVGLSCCFRQWRAESHCRFLHGYAIKVHMIFSSTELDIRNWVVDFGSLKPIKAKLEEMYDHKTLVAKDDPELERFRTLDEYGLIQLREVDATGCEAMAHEIAKVVSTWMYTTGLQKGETGKGIVLESVTASEHSGNSATYKRTHHA